MHDVEDHDRGLAHDLAVIRQQMSRRQALILAGSAGTVGLLAACGSGTSGGTTTTSSTSTTGSTSTTSTSTTSGSTSTGGTAACSTGPTAIAGPYPADGTNTAPGSTSNVLPVNGIIRSNIRSSFIGAANVAPGVPVALTLTLVNTNAACARLANYAIYLWQADRDGLYSLYTRPNESWLRGLQTTDANGQLTFLTNFPPAYDGRYPHMHFEIFSTLAAATSGRSALLTSQFAMPRDIATTVFATTGYGVAQTQLAGVTTGSDLVFRNFSAAQLAVATPTFTGDATAGYAASATIGVAV